MSSKFIGLLVNEGLYSDLPISAEITSLYELENFIYDENQLDVHCIHCQKESTFRSVFKSYGGFSPFKPSSRMDLNPQSSFKVLLKENKNIIKEFLCSRNKEHKLTFHLLLESDKIIKIGQYPTIADLNVSSIKKYKKILSHDYVEFSKAIGLFSHGIGVGSFVYLRRIFENLIEDAKNKASEVDGWDQSLYEKSRMHEKITLLKDVLPEFLVRNSALYGILSKGIHELSEDECLRYFPVVQTGIELILDEKLERMEKENKTKRISEEILKIKAQLQN
ncbi:hypothetical protein [Brevibacillus choshinensis]|uniref:hypothetical protein n=1 Tax=Brevibacillus choshinensis TaxID=54911 RepID=UPI002E1D8F1A|nr:hypothetical protein [Brevibacillus choshinensis]